MIKITGLDQIGHELEEAQAALAEIGDELGTVNFDPHDPASIEKAIQAMEDLIDSKVGEYAGNSIIGPIIEQMKEQYRDGIIQRASEARLDDDRE